MIALIIKSYLTILLSVGGGSLLLFILGIYTIFKAFAKTPERPQKTAINVTMPDPGPIQDVTAIAGEDVLATKLDLARAFIETGKLNSAKAILSGVCKQGNADQQQEAKRLLQFT